MSVTQNHAHESSVSHDPSRTEHDGQSCPLWFWILASIAAALVVGVIMVAAFLCCCCPPPNPPAVPASHRTTPPPPASTVRVPDGVSTIALPVVGQTNTKHAAWLVPAAKPKASLTTTVADVAVLDLVPPSNALDGLTLVNDIPGKLFDLPFAEFTSPMPKADSPSTTQWVNDMDVYVNFVFADKEATAPPPKPSTASPGPTTRVILRVSFELKSDVSESDFFEEMKKVVQGTSKEEGCSGYQLFRDPGRGKGAFVLFESFKSLEAQSKEHMSKEYMKGPWTAAKNMMVEEKPASGNPYPKISAQKFFVYNA